MKRTTLAATAALGAFAALTLAGPSAVAGSPAPSQGDRNGFTMAVYGDAPYGVSNSDTSEFAATPAFIDSVNADPDVSGVIHLGDIHSGKQYCTESYDRAVAALWTRFADPLVYTPGDNEWADCHKPKEGGGVIDPVTGQPVDYAAGNPVANLDLVRSIFFPTPGATLGSGTLQVTSQATAYDPRYPTDSQYVENVLWQRKGIVFVTVNIPGGSNNDADPWFATASTGAGASAEQTQEIATRTAADLRWLDKAFATATAQDARGVVVLTQADMWDLDGNTAAHVANYEPFVAELAQQTTAFGGPVLLLNGDSHTYRSDNPLVAGAPCVGDAGVCSYDAALSHPGYDVPNFHRIVVHGSTAPLEWLKLTVDSRRQVASGPNSFGPFGWTRITRP